MRRCYNHRRLVLPGGALNQPRTALLQLGHHVQDRRVGRKRLQIWVLQRVAPLDPVHLRSETAERVRSRARASKVEVWSRARSGKVQARGQGTVHLQHATKSSSV